VVHVTSDSGNLLAVTDPQDPPDDNAILAFLMRNTMGSAVPHIPSEAVSRLLVYMDSNVVRNWLLDIMSSLNPDLDLTEAVTVVGNLVMPRMSVSGTVTVTPPPPYPADLVRQDAKVPAVKTSNKQFWTLVVVLVFVMAIIGPFVEQHLSAHAQSLTNEEVGAFCAALGIIAILQAMRK
jgi:hypothetical protein